MTHFWTSRWAHFVGLLIGILLIAIGTIGPRVAAQTVVAAGAEIVDAVKAIAKRLDAVEAELKKWRDAPKALPAPQPLPPPAPTPAPKPDAIFPPNNAGSTAVICGASFNPKSAMQDFTDAGITTKLWRDVVTACGETLTLDWWQYDAKHWALTIRRALENPTGARRAGLALTSELYVDGKSVAKVSGALFEMQMAYLEAYRLPPRFAVADLVKARKIPPINMFRAPIQNVFVDGNYNRKAYASLSADGTLARAMPMTGERADLGLVHEWCASWIGYHDIAGKYWWEACTDAALDSANVPWHVARRDGLPTLWDDAEFKGKGFDPRNVTYAPNTAVVAPLAQGWQLDDAHQPFAQLVPYMATRHPLFLWLAQFQAASLLGGYTCPIAYCKADASDGRSLMLGTQIRGTAWSFRTLTQVVLMTPETVPSWLHSAARYQAILERSERRLRADILEPSTRYWQALAEGRAATMKNPEGCGPVKATGRVSCGTQMWMYDFWAQGLGFATWAGVKGIEPSYQLLTEQLIYRYGNNAPTRTIGAPFTMVFSNPFLSEGEPMMANELFDLVIFTPSENLAYGSNAPIKVGADGSLGEWPQMGWHVQGNAAFCALNGDARCLEIARWWEAQFKIQKAANPSWYGGWEYAKYRIKFD